MRRVVVAAFLVTLAGSAVAQTRSSPSAPGPADTKVRLQTLGYKDIHDMRRGPDGQWTGTAAQNGVRKNVTVSPDGTTTAR